jgi:hypothetical protein
MPPPPTGTTGVELRHVLQHFERDRALACDDARIVVGMHEHQLLRRRQPMRLGGGFGQRVAMQDNARAMAACMLHLRVGREGRHDDGGGNAEPAGMIGHALGMVAGRHSDDAALSFVGRELQQGVERAALLERGGELQVLELDPDVGLGDARQRLAPEARRVHHGAADARGGELDVFQRDGQGGHHAASRRSIQSRVRYQAPIMGKNHGSPL